MDIALIVGVVLGLAAMIGSIAYALFVEGSAGGFGNFIFGGEKFSLGICLGGYFLPNTMIQIRSHILFTMV